MENIQNNPRMLALIKKIQAIDASPRTKTGIIKEGALKLVVGIIGWIAIFILAASVGGFQKLFSYFNGLGAVAALIGFVFIFALPFYGLGQILVGLFSPQRHESCPYCAQKISLLTKVHSSICPNCGKLLYYSDKANTSEMIKVECPVCQTEWGMAKDLEKVTCQTCGNSMQSQNGTFQSLPADGVCTACKKPVQKQAFFCPHCGELLTQPSLVRAPFRPDTETWSGGFFEEKVLDGYLPDGMIREGYLSNSAKGYIIQAVWLENTIRKELILAFSKNTSLSYYTFVYWLGRLDRMIAQLDFAIELNPNFTTVAQELFAETDMLLRWCLRQAIDWKNGKFYQLLEPKSFFSYEKRIRNYLNTISQVRNQFLYKLRATANDSNRFLSLEPWEEPVFDFGHENEGANLRVFIRDWESALKGKWFDSVTRLKSGVALPAIRVPKIILEELNVDGKPLPASQPPVAVIPQPVQAESQPPVEAISLPVQAESQPPVEAISLPSQVESQSQVKVIPLPGLAESQPPLETQKPAPSKTSPVIESIQASEASQRDAGKTGFAPPRETQLKSQASEAKSERTTTRKNKSLYLIALIVGILLVAVIAFGLIPKLLSGRSLALLNGPAPTPACAFTCNVGSDGYSFDFACESGTVMKNMSDTTKLGYDASGQLSSITVAVNQKQTYVNTNHTYNIVGTIVNDETTGAISYDITATGGALGNASQTCKSENAGQSLPAQNMPTFAPEPTSTPAATATRVPTATTVPTDTPVPTATLVPFVIQDAKFQNFKQNCNTDINITSVDGDSFKITVNTTITMINGGWAIFCYGAKHTWIGTLTYAGYTFASDQSNPLQFMVKPEGYTYIGGTGTVKSPDGTTTSLTGSAAPAANPPATAAPPATLSPVPATNTPVSPVGFTKVYISDAFDDNSYEWSVGDVAGQYWVGTRLIQNGVLDWNGISKEGMYSHVGPERADLQDNISDQQVSAKVKLVNQDMSGYYGLYLRAKDEQNFYIFIVSGDQFAFLMRQNSDWKTLIDWKEDSHVTNVGWNIMTVQVVGSHFSLYFNDSLVGEADDASMPSGLSGVVVEADKAGEKIQVQFDDFEVRLP